MNGASFSTTARLARRVWPPRNSLARGIDRFESFSLIAVVLLAMLLLPIMLALGSSTHASMVEKSEQQARNRFEAVAVLTEPTPAASASTGVPGGPVAGKSKVPAEWTEPDGSTRTGGVWARDGLQAGAKVEIWVDRDGRVVDPPITSGAAAMSAVMVASFGWLAVIGLLGLVQSGIHHLFERRRYREWDTEWANVEPDWNNDRR